MNVPRPAECPEQVWAAVHKTAVPHQCPGCTAVAALIAAAQASADALHRYGFRREPRSIPVADLLAALNTEEKR
jgi:hypothetical protein